MFKHLVEIHQVRDALAAHFDAPVRDLSPIDVGQMARVFSFTVNGMNYVARFTTKRAAESIKKDRWPIGWPHQSSRCLPSSTAAYRAICITGSHAEFPELPCERFTAKITDRS